MQRASPASTRCSGDHASSSGSGEPPSSLRAVPSRSTETAYENVLALVATEATYTHLMSLAILGVTGFTGRLVLDEARRAGLRVRLVGRRREALEALAGRARRCASPTRATTASLGTRLRGRDRRRVARRPVSRARPRARCRRRSAAGAHYLDTTGEQEFVRLVHDRVQAETVVLPAFGFDYVPGDLAARLAAEKVEGPLDEVVVAYSVEGRRNEPGDTAHDRPRDGSEAGRLAGRPARPVRASARRRARSRFPFGERTVVEWGGTEPLTVPRHTDVRNVRSYIRAPAIAAKAGGLGRLAAPFVRAASRFGPSGPSEASRRKSRFTVVAEARGPGGNGRAVVEGTDVYGLTALPDRPRRRGSPRRRGARRRCARAGRGLRRPHVRRPARAVPADRGVMSSGPALTVRVDATAPNAERGRVLRPLLRVAGRGRREGRQRRPSALPLRDAHLRRAAPVAL